MDLSKVKVEFKSSINDRKVSFESSDWGGSSWDDVDVRILGIIYSGLMFYNFTYLILLILRHYGIK